MQKNNDIKLKIEDFSADGSGIGKIEGMTFFVKDTVIGDTVDAKVMKLKKKYGFARLMRVLEPSPFRVEPRCLSARPCGGCQIQEMAYEEQLRFKERKVRENLQRIGGFVPEEIPMEPIVGMENPWRYRNKAQFPVGLDKNGRIVAGFYAGHTHSIINQRDCQLGVKENAEILDRVIAHMEREQIRPYEERTGLGLVRHILIRYGFRTKEIMVCLVINGMEFPGEGRLVQSLTEIPGMTSISLNVNRERTNVILGREVRLLWGKPYIEDMIGNVRYRISPLSFFQVNPVQTEKLYRLALEYAGLTGTETVWDLYCGIGTISLFLARHARQVYGVEIVPQAVEDARDNAKRNGISNVSFFLGRAEEILPEYYESYPRTHGGETAHADVLVVDPPRKGCDVALLQTMLAMHPDRIVYVSCDSATLARDLKILREGGYRLERCRAVDQFPMSVHVETVCLLSKLRSDKHIELEVKMDELDLTAAESKATYEEIKAYVLEKFGLKVSSLYISQVKRKCGIIERANYNLPKSENFRQPQCPPEKEKAIRAALEHFQMI